MTTVARTCLLCAMILLGQASLAQEQVYTSPELFRGALYLAISGSSDAVQLSPTQSGILQAELDRTNNEGWLVGLGSAESGQRSEIWKLLTARDWTEPPKLTEQKHWNDELNQQIQKLKRGSCVWVDQAELNSTADAERPRRAELLQQCLQRGVLVVLEATAAQSGTRLADQWNLMPDIELVYIDEQPQEPRNLSENQIRLQITGGCLLRVGRRELINLSEPSTSICYCDLPATRFFPQALQESIGPRKIVDLVAAKRALIERTQPVFPSDRDYKPELKNGSLVIVGGGGAPAEMWTKFVELAGGKDSRLVILPTAVAEPEFEDHEEARLLKRFGAGEVRVLPQNTREDVCKEEFLNELRWATGIWFGGGRQWRFVDAYWGTPAWHEIKQVLARGGVIGGSSAGATIQGDLLVRGHPLGNHIMIADGYRRGLGLLEGVAIDQHFKQRNRFDDLASVAKRFPKIHCIGIDESTALVVESANRCSVLGKGSVWLLPPEAKDQQFIEHPSGDTFTLIP